LAYSTYITALVAAVEQQKLPKKLRFLKRSLIFGKKGVFYYSRISAKIAVFLNISKNE
jgi:hypothetical protein